MIEKLNEEKRIEIQIIDLIKNFIDNKDIVTFKVGFDGNLYASSKTHKSARGMIMFPKEICTTNLKDLGKWTMFVMAIPREKVQEYVDKKFDELKNID